MIRGIAKALKLFLAVTLGFQLGMVLSPKVFVTFQPQIMHGTYIRSIDVPSLGEEKVKKILDKFNKMGYDEIVSYEGWRPIDIKEVSNLEGAIVGVAAVGVMKCEIELESSIFRDEIEAEQVIIHEYLHCLGYEHTSDPEDIMFATYNESSEENIRKYAEDVYNRLNRW